MILRIEDVMSLEWRKKGFQQRFSIGNSTIQGHLEDQVFQGDSLQIGIRVGGDELRTERIEVLFEGGQDAGGTVVPYVSGWMDFFFQGFMLLQTFPFFWGGRKF